MALIPGGIYTLKIHPKAYYVFYNENSRNQFAFFKVSVLERNFGKIQEDINYRIKLSIIIEDHLSNHGEFFHKNEFSQLNDGYLGTISDEALKLLDEYFCF